MEKLRHLYRRTDSLTEACFNIQESSPLTEDELKTLRLILADGFVEKSIYQRPRITGKNVIEIGPQLNFETAWSSNLVTICHIVGLTKVVRVEPSTRFAISANESREEFLAENLDPMTQMVYEKPIQSFVTGLEPTKIWTVPLIKEGADALKKIAIASFDEFERQLIWDYFVNTEKRDPTIAEVLDWANANSDHCRHWVFNAIFVLDGVKKEKTLFQLVKEPYLKNPGQNLCAFDDNSGVITGDVVEMLIPSDSTGPSPCLRTFVRVGITETAETHNFPTGVSPFGGAETGVGGRQRDGHDVRRGARLLMSFAGYGVGNLYLPSFPLPWEDRLEYPENLASSRKILLRGSDGVSDYSNKSGEPLGSGFVQSIDITLGEVRWAYQKPILYSAGTGMIDGSQLEKNEPQPGMTIVQIGGPAYRIGLGGGAASSKMQGDQAKELDFHAVQRGNAEMARKNDRVVYACICLGEENPIFIAHDQGAGGVANAVKEAVGKAGGRIDIRRVKVGDATMSVHEIYVAEFQERECFLVKPGKLEVLQKICRRENDNCEVLGEITGDGRFVVIDSADNSVPVDLDLKAVLGELPQKIYHDTKSLTVFPILSLPDCSPHELEDMFWRVLHLPSVAAKDYLTIKIDRSVKGVMAQQPCCGPLQLTVADFAAAIWSHHNVKGTASSIGEKAFLMIGDPVAGAKMAVAEAILNLAGAKIDDLKNIGLRANWMWAPKLPGEGAAIYEAAEAFNKLLLELGIAINGGKDSSSMATRNSDGSIVKSPRELVIFMSAYMPDVRIKATPDIKEPGNSSLVHIDLANGKRRLGGSALAQAHKQMGNEFPDLENAATLVEGFEAIQELISKDLVSAYHDVSGGGLSTTVMEMAFAGNCGINLTLGSNIIGDLFAEELGAVIEVKNVNLAAVQAILDKCSFPAKIIGQTTIEKQIVIRQEDQLVYTAAMQKLRWWWQELAVTLIAEQTNDRCGQEYAQNVYDRKGLNYQTNFTPQEATLKGPGLKDKNAFVLRAEGTNGEEEMRAFAEQVGFKTYDVNITDLLDDKITLDDCDLLLLPGGFSFADVPDSAKGTAAIIRSNSKLAKMFADFYDRSNTLSLGVCNGCQLSTLLNLVPIRGLSDDDQPRLIHNLSGRFEHHWVSVKIPESPAIIFKGMAGSILGIHSAHGEGYFKIKKRILNKIIKKNLVALYYVNDNGEATESYPFNPNGSPLGIAGLTTKDGRHTVMMPHPERAFKTFQWHYLPKWQQEKWGGISPWVMLLANALNWLREH